MCPLLTMFYETHPLWQTCNLVVNIGTPTYIFHFFHFVILANSLLIDAICYGRILNYMRANRVRVTVIATTRIGGFPIEIETQLSKLFFL